VTSVGGRVLASGGLDSADSSVANIVAIDGGAAKNLGSLPSPVHDAGSTTVAGTPYFFGGGNGGSTSQQILRIDPSGTTSNVGSLLSGESDITAAAVGGTAYIVAGYDGTNPLDDIVAWKPGSPARIVAHLPKPLRYPAVATVGTKVLVAGGTSGSTVSSDVFSFDPATGQVSKVATLPQPLTHLSGAALNGKFVLVGGRGIDKTSQVASILSVDPASGRVTRIGSLPTALSDTGSTAVAGGITVVGGVDSSGAVRAGILRLQMKTITVQAATKASASAPSGAVEVPVAGSIPPLLDPNNVYAAEKPGLLSPTVAGDRELVYVPNSESNTMDVIDQKTYKVIDHFDTGRLPQHVVPSWDLKTLWITNDYGNSLTAIDPKTGKPGRTVSVEDPYNLYFTADGTRAIVVAEALRKLDFRDAQTMKLENSLSVDSCHGVDHMDFTADGKTALVSCEFGGRMIVLDLVHEKVLGTTFLAAAGMPQDVKLSPDGKVFYVADMASNGVWMIDAATFKRIGFIRTGAGAHGLYPSRDQKYLYVSNRGEGTISLIDFATRTVARRWSIPGGGTPDMGGVSADGKVLWLSGRHSSVVYAIDTTDGKLIAKVPVGSGPHGLAVWPQPGRYSIGHTGILR
jgi:YVTN family beta-propeller protein